jgi:heme exporter protein D
MNQLITWFTMSGYSIYIWPAYGLVCVVLIMNLLGMKIQQSQTKKKLQQWFKRQ